MPTVGIRELKARLSAYIRQARAGRTVFVTDHGEIVAELRAPESLSKNQSAALRMDEAVAAGWLTPAESPEDRSWLGAPAPGLPPGTAAELLNRERGES
jgi:antitoxin (DNA-binding transcriptional repressor) of toxin-antitoxin stability system